MLCTGCCSVNIRRLDGRW